MFRLIRALFYFATGRFHQAYEVMMANRYVMEATYDASIGKGQDRVQTVKDAVSKLIVIQEKKVAQIQQLTADYNRLEQVKSGAAAKAKQHVSQLQTTGRSAEQIKADAEYIRCMTAYNDATSTAKEKEARIHDLETEIAEKGKLIATYKAQLQTMQRNNEKLKEEKSEAIADVAIARESEQINDLLSGLAQDTTDKDLTAAREARLGARARSKVAGELAGADAKSAESEFIQFAQNTHASSEFDALIGLDGGTKNPTEAAKLPES